MNRSTQIAMLIFVALVIVVLALYFSIDVPPSEPSIQP
jgi:hypothetical protein